MEKHLIISFQNNNSLQIKNLYNEHRDSFFSFGKKYNLTESELSDIYQDAFIALRKQAISGKLNKINCSLKTYFFGIGKYLIYDELKRKKKLFPLLNNTESDTVEIIQISPKIKLTVEQKLLQKHFIKLGKKCQQVLTLFFYRGLSNEEIALKEGYENEAVVRSHKSRCLKKLKETINSPK
ncbi:MAG: sigma-70 family RNA polymerase sigma factor [Flavobacteriaceae bacterium]